MWQHLNSICNVVPTHLNTIGLLLIFLNSFPITPLDQSTQKSLLIITIEIVTLQRNPIYLIQLLTPDPTTGPELTAKPKFVHSDVIQMQ